MLEQMIDVQNAFMIQNKQYSESLLLNDVVPAGQQKLATVAISNLGHFLCNKITGSFETLEDINGDIVDTGVNYLKGKLVDGSNQRALFNDMIPLNMFLSGGHTRSATATNNLTTATPSGNLFYPIELNYLFTINSEIQLVVYNSSNVDLEYNIMFHGDRIREAIQ